MLTHDIVYLQLPLQIRYLPVLRSMAGVVGGVGSLDYDQIMHIRLAVSEVFEFVRRRAPPASALADGFGLGCTFDLGPDGLEILITPPGDVSFEHSGPEDEESLALLNSLMNAVEIDAAKRTLRMVMYASASRT
jgi:hypothetical protein